MSEAKRGFAIAELSDVWAALSRTTFRETSAIVFVVRVPVRRFSALHRWQSETPNGACSCRSVERHARGCRELQGVNSSGGRRTELCAKSATRS